VPVTIIIEGFAYGSGDLRESVNWPYACKPATQFR
jgi:hypothetical protein